MIRRTKIIAWDVYGTMIAAEDPDNELPPRKGLIEVLERTKGEGIISCTCSDGNTVVVRCDLESSRVNPEYFDHFFEMEKGIPKNLGVIWAHYKQRIPDLEGDQILVIGDRLDRDIYPAQSLGFRAIHFQEYFGSNDNNIDISKMEIP